MAQDLRRLFTVKNCAAAKNMAASDDQKRKDFFGSLGAIGDIEVLNRFGASKITAGLRDLANISDSIRTGKTDAAIIPNDRGYVLDAVGINPIAAQKAGQFNPSVLNKATAQAESILDSVKGGNFKLSDVADALTDLQNLSSLTDGIFTDDKGASVAKSLAVCGATPYAIDLVNYAPKYKFLFIVQVTLKKTYREAYGATEQKLAFVVKTSTRPNITIDHEEINMYNFWTRVPKRVIYEPVTMRFYDDNKGLAHLFYTQYLQSISPISREGGFNNGYMSYEYLEANSMGHNTTNSISSASLSALEGNLTSIIDEIKLFHVYDYGKFMNVYHFHHPKLLTMNLDDLDMAETGTGNEIEFQFAYDAMHITPAFSVQKNQETVATITGKDNGMLHSIVPNFGPAQQEETPEGTDSEGNIKVPESENILKTVSSSISSGINSVTGLVSNAFNGAAGFAGSLFK